MRRGLLSEVEVGHKRFSSPYLTFSSPATGGGSAPAAATARARPAPGLPGGSPGPAGPVSPATAVTRAAS